MTLGWSDAEELLCVQDDGLVVIYDIFGKYQHKFSMGPEAKDTKVSAVKYVNIELNRSHDNNCR